MRKLMLGSLRLSRAKILCCLAAVVAVLPVWGGSLWAAAETPRGAACLDCHDDAVASFNNSFHARIWQGAHDCSVCHGPTQHHLQADDPSAKSIISFNKGDGHSALELNKQCLGCHSRTRAL